MTEERISQRVFIELPAQFCFKDSPDAWFQATIVNISTHGFCFRTEAKYNEAFHKNEIVCLTIEISKEESVVFDIKVVWSGRTGNYNCLVGGEILNPSSSDYQKILEFYTKLFRSRPEKSK